MEEGVAAPVRRIDAAAQIVPAPDAMHRLVADDLFQDHRRRRPVDPAQHQEAAVEPRREQMHEVGIDRLEIVAVIERVEQLLAHAHQRGGAAGREIEPAQQLLPARLGGGMDFGGGLVRGRGLPGGDGGIEPRRGPARNGSPAPRKRRCAGRWSARRIWRGFRSASATPDASPRPGQQFLAQFRQGFRARRRIAAAVARAVEQRPAALGNAVEHLAEKGRVHGSRKPRPLELAILPEMLKV